MIESYEDGIVSVPVNGHAPTFAAPRRTQAPADVPMAIEAEHGLLASILKWPDCLADVRGTITAADFYEPRNSAIYTAITASADRAVSLTFETLVNIVRPDDAEYVLLLAEAVTHVNHAAEYARVIADTAHRRRVIDVAQRMLRSAQAVHDPDAIPKVETLAMEILDTRRGGGPRVASDFAADVLAEVDAAQEIDPEERGLRTGLHDLDRIIGGLRPGTVTVVAARPSQGKSSFATTLLRNVCVGKGVPCVLFTVEVVKGDALRNLACCEAGVNGHLLMHGKLPDVDYAAFTVGFAMARAAPLYVDDGGLTASNIRASCKRLALAHGVRLAVVDYIQLLSAEPDAPRNQNREREVSAMSQTLKRAAQESGIPIVVLAQLNREVSHRPDRKPQLSDLRESGSIEQDADIVLLLWSSPAEAESGKTSLIEPIKIIVGKNRAGPSGVATVVLRKECTRFESIAAFETTRWEASFSSKPITHKRGSEGWENT